MALDCKEVPRFVGDTVIEVIPPPSLNLRNMVSARKSSSSSSTIVISKSPLSGRSRTVCSPTPAPICNGMITSSSIGTIKESALVDPKNQDNKHKKPKIIAKDNPISPLSFGLKASEVSRVTSSPVLKESTSVGKDCPKHPSSRSSLVESSQRPSGVGDPASLLQSHHAVPMQNKNFTSNGQQRGEKAPQSNLQSLSKWTPSAFADLPSSSNSPAGLSDEELALPLHQELNSSPRVSRVPRVRHVGSLPQLSASSSSMLIKHTSSSGGKDQHTTTASRKKRKIDAEPPDTESDDGEDRTFRGDKSKSFESNKEEYSKGSRRYARTSCSSGVQARGTKTDRKRRKVEPGSDGTGSFSDSGEESVSSEDGSQGSGTCTSKSVVSAS